jgi:hypothetical protein
MVFGLIPLIKEDAHVHLFRRPVSVALSMFHFLSAGRRSLTFHSVPVLQLSYVGTFWRLNLAASVYLRYYWQAADGVRVIPCILNVRSSEFI